MVLDITGETMITKDEFTKMLTFEQGILLRQVSDLSHADSLLQPQPAGNCLNWVLGHLVQNQVDILKAIGGKTPTDLPDLAHYRIGSEPITCDGDGVIHLQQLTNTYTLISELITDHLEHMSKADFDEEIDFWQGKHRRGYVAFFYFFHHTYHIGQLEQLRNLAGKTEKVI